MEEPAIRRPDKTEGLYPKNLCPICKNRTECFEYVVPDVCVLGECDPTYKEELEKQQFTCKIGMKHLTR